MRKRLSDLQGRQAKQAAAGLRREITNDFKYDKKKIKHLQKILHNVNVALGTLGSAMGEFSRVKGPAISPDGLIGGLGFIMPIKNVKEVLTTSIHTLSEVADSLADELSNPHWQAKDDKETKKVIKEKEEVEEETQKALEPNVPDEAESEDSEESESEDEENEDKEDEEKPEENPEEKPQPQSENNPNEGALNPEDLVNKSAGINPTKVLSSAVRKALVRFSSVGKKI